MVSNPNLKADLETLFKDFRWTTKGFIDDKLTAIN